MLSYDLVLMRDTSAKRSSSGGAQPFTSQRIDGVVLAAREARQEFVTISIPANVRVATAIVQNLSYETKAQPGAPGQRP